MIRYIDCRLKFFSDRAESVPCCYGWDCAVLGESLRGRSVVISGASKGIGEEMAYVACSHGARVLLTARSKDLLAKAGRHLRLRRLHAPMS